MAEKGWTIAVVGATGLVGNEIVNLLSERAFPFGDLRCYASDRSAGERVGERGVPVELLDRADFDGVDIAFFAASEAITAAWAGRATQAGATVIDLSQLYAADPEVPLVVPEVNPGALADCAAPIIASPCVAALQLAVVLEPLRAVAGLKRIVVTSYQPASEVGRAGIDELSQQTAALLGGRDAESQTFPQRIAFSVFPQVGEFLAAGYTRGERELIAQTRRLLDDVALAITATCVRVPVFYGLCQSVNIETVESLTADTARELLRRAPGVLVEDDPCTGVYPSPATAVGIDAICVGRLRDDESAPHAINLWIVGDNLRRGSALNAVAIAEMLVRDHR